MKNDHWRKAGINILGILTAVGFLGSLLIYRYLEPQLSPANPTLSEEVLFWGKLPVFVLLLGAVYHLLLFLYGLQRFQSNLRSIFLHSFYLAAVILSGINLATDFTLLTDIGHEYPYWDVSAYWTLLNLDTLFHLGIVGIGLVLNWDSKKLRLSALFEQIQHGDDVLFQSMHQMGFLCAGMGMAGVLWILGAKVTESYTALYMLVAVVYALFPCGLMAVYWGIRNRKKPLRDWMDEKQFSDMAFGSLMCLVIMLPSLLVIGILSALAWVILPAYAWILLVFLLMLGCYSLVMVLKYHAIDLKEY